MKVYTMLYRTHKSYEESHWVSRLRENLTSGSDGEGLETDPLVPRQPFTRQVFYKDAKQHLQLGKCQCNSFDSQIGAATLAMMQYIMLLLYKQMHYGQSIGSIFDLLSSQAEEQNITRYLLDIFWEIVNGIGEILKIDCIKLFREMIRENQRAEEIMKLFSPVFEQKTAA